MRTRRKVEVTYRMDADELDFSTAEPLLLLHMNQKLDFANGHTLLGFTQVEVGLLRRLIVKRAEELGVVDETRYPRTSEVKPT